jgi:lipid-binding SYLF domain-containing protein
VSLEGSTLRQDNGAIQNLYGRKLSAREIIRERAVSNPAGAKELVSLLNSKSRRNTSDPSSLK